MRWLLLFLVAPVALFAKIEFESEIARTALLLMDVKTGEILFDEEGTTELPCASTTKIPMALFVLEQMEGRLDELTKASQDAIGTIAPDKKKAAIRTLPSHWIEVGGTHMTIHRDEVLPVGVLLEGLLIASADDAANVLAYHISGSVPRFMKAFNARIKERGAENTTFTNPHGLHHPDHLSTAYDLALMTRLALEKPLFRELIAKTVFERPETEKQAAFTLPQSYRHVCPGPHYYSKALGGKTGTTEDAGTCLVAVAKDGEREFIAVAPGCESDGERHTLIRELFDAGFQEELIPRTLMKAGPLPYTRKVAGAKGAVKCSLPRDLVFEHYPSSHPEVTGRMEWLPLELPVRKGMEVGQVIALDSAGYVVAMAPVVAANNLGVPMSKGSKIALLVGVVLFVIVIASRRKSRRARRA